MKLLITIEVERDDAPLTDTDIARSVAEVASMVELADATNEPIDGGRWGVRWGYRVDDVKP